MCIGKSNITEYSTLILNRHMYYMYMHVIHIDTFKVIIGMGLSITISTTLLKKMKYFTRNRKTSLQACVRVLSNLPYADYLLCADSFLRPHILIQDSQS